LGAFLVPFLGSIFDPFLANSLRASCWFYGTFSMSKVVFGPFLDGFLTVHLVTIFPTLGPPGAARWLSGGCCPLVAYQVDAALASGPFVDQYRGRELLLAAYFAGFRPILWGISSDPGHIKS
jgi:hypothetical protein